MIDKPTAERILQAFADVSLTIIKNAVGEGILRRLTPLSGLQEDILQRLGLGASLYGQLETYGSLKFEGVLHIVVRSRYEQDLDHLQ